MKLSKKLTTAVAVMAAVASISVAGVSADTIDLGQVYNTEIVAYSNGSFDSFRDFIIENGTYDSEHDEYNYSAWYKTYEVHYSYDKELDEINHVSSVYNIKPNYDVEPDYAVHRSDLYLNFSRKHTPAVRSITRYGQGNLMEREGWYVPASRAFYGKRIIFDVSGYYRDAFVERSTTYPNTIEGIRKSNADLQNNVNLAQLFMNREGVGVSLEDFGILVTD